MELIPTQHHDKLYIDFFFQWDRPSSRDSFCLLEWRGDPIDVYTNDMSNSNQRAHGFLIFKEICIRWTRFYRSIRDFFSDSSRGKWSLVLTKRIAGSGYEIAVHAGSFSSNSKSSKKRKTLPAGCSRTGCGMNNNQGLVYLVCFHISLQCIQVDKYMSAGCQRVYRCHHLGNNQVYRPLSE